MADDQMTVSASLLPTFGSSREIEAVYDGSLNHGEERVTVKQKENILIDFYKQD